MAKVVGYHRPSSLDEALAMLGEPGAARVVLGGGTIINDGTDRAEVEVIDLQALGLDGITAAGDRLVIGSTATLQDLVDHPATPPVVAELARREAPSTLRAMATVGGLIAHGDPESELLAALLVHDATVDVVTGAGAVSRHLASVLAEGLGGGVIVAAAITTGGRATVERTGRTPADRAICAVVGRRAEDGTIRLAACGAGPTPILFDDAARLEPVADFRGSAEYRRHLIDVHTARVREALA